MMPNDIRPDATGGASWQETLKALAHTLAEFWEGYMKDPTGC